MTLYYFIFRNFVNGTFRFSLVGVVTGNPSTCILKTLPDVYNFVGDTKVDIFYTDTYLVILVELKMLCLVQILSWIKDTITAGLTTSTAACKQMKGIK